ncbi:MAG: sarcosine oxidase subunit gamma [Alphaproteobacteria bacterium]|nr:sarcosine oxidase subunit gamma [Alphaproteobacteria bacterium]
MVDLTGLSALEGLLPYEVDGAVLSAVSYGAITSIMPFRGQKTAVNVRLKADGGAALPRIGRVSGPVAKRLIWAGRGQYLLLDLRRGAAFDTTPDPAFDELAALSDQTSAWVVMRLEGARAQEVLARLCPLDLRAGVFKRGHVARTELAHMAVILWRRPKGFEIMVVRSVAQVAMRRLSGAMDSVAAQAVLGEIS